MSEHEVEITIPATVIRAKIKLSDLIPPPPFPDDPLPDPGTAFTLVQNATVLEPHDLYNCNPTIDFPTFDSKRKPGSIVLAYTAVTIMPRYGAQSAYYNGMRALLTEADYWHTASPPSIANRLAHPTHPASLWLVRPSAELATSIANYNVANLNPLFQGTMCDESQLQAPKKYVDAWRTAVEWVEADLSKYQMDWAAAVTAQFAAYKAAWGSGRAVIANSAGAPYPGIDGFTVEASHINALGANGLDWVKSQALAQKALWNASPVKFGSAPIIITWNYPDKIPGVYLGTSA